MTREENIERKKNKELGYYDNGDDDEEFQILCSLPTDSVNSEYEEMWDSLWDSLAEMNGG
jgi:hypothetical protein